MEGDTKSKRRGRKPLANPARCKVQVMLTDQELAVVRHRAGLVPLGTLFREMTFAALGIPARSREAAAD